MTRRAIRAIPLLLVSAHPAPVWASFGIATSGYGRWVLLLLLFVAGWIAEHRSRKEKN